MSRTRVAVLISGRGSNLQALIDAARAPDYPAEIALALANRPDAQGLALAGRNGVATAVVDHGAFRGDRRGHEEAVHAVLDEHAIAFVALAGWMRVLTPWLVGAWEGRMLNIHPSLLPLFPGLDTHARALAAGVKVHGCTVHWVSEGVDAGRIVGQAAVPVLDRDTEATLAGRVLAAEHRLYPLCLGRALSGQGTSAPLDPDALVISL